MNLESVQAFLSENVEGKNYLQSFADTSVTDAIKTYETKTLSKKLEEEISERYPPESEEAKQLRELKTQFEQSQKEAAHEKLFNQALSIATGKSLPSKLVEFFVGEDPEKTTANLGNLKKDYAAYIWLLQKLAKETGISVVLDGSGNGIKSHRCITDNLKVRHTETHIHI
ncbi:DUF4355 domain-containing protein [Lysinibacillus xylanilyticus]|uniref:DUF4355 domain-containing protein n=1 Tax=Lysinibacillus xylanilyticus TaxID=582475 RepID=UPI0037F12B99